MINLFGCGFSGQINYALQYMDLYRSARQAGINRTFSHKVANGSLTLAEALGDMDNDSESAFMEMMGIDVFIDGEQIIRGASSAEFDSSLNRISICTNRSGSSDDFDCGCRGAQYCDDCIPF